MLRARLNVVTLGVNDLPSMRSFYEALGWTSHSRAAPGEPFALQGCVVTPDQAVEPGCVVVAGDTIAV